MIRKTLAIIGLCYAATVVFSWQQDWKEHNQQHTEELAGQLVGD